jgi:hypothetical protein
MVYMVSCFVLWTRLSSEQKICFENFVADLESNLGELDELYPSIPAIEVTIPHVHTSISPVQEIKGFLNKNIVVPKFHIVPAASVCRGVCGRLL